MTSLLNNTLRTERLYANKSTIIINHCAAIGKVVRLVLPLPIGRENQRFKAINKRSPLLLTGLQSSPPPSSPPIHIHKTVSYKVRTQMKKDNQNKLLYSILQCEVIIDRWMIRGNICFFM